MNQRWVVVSVSPTIERCSNPAETLGRSMAAWVVDSEGFYSRRWDRSDLVVIYYPVASSGLPYHVRCWANVMCNAPEYLNSSMNLKVERREPVNVRVYALIVSIGETWLL